MVSESFIEGSLLRPPRRAQGYDDRRTTPRQTNRTTSASHAFRPLRSTAVPVVPGTNAVAGLVLNDAPRGSRRARCWGIDRWGRARPI